MPEWATEKVGLEHSVRVQLQPGLGQGEGRKLGKNLNLSLSSLCLYDLMKASDIYNRGTVTGMVSSVYTKDSN